MGTPEEHSSLGPSSWGRFVRCPASVQASVGLPDKALYEAAEGTVFHELMADCLDLGLDPEDCIGGGRGLMVDGYWIEYDEEMADSGRDGLDYVRNMASTPGWELFVETRVDISPYTLPGQFGTADVTLINVEKREIIVFDWKYGKEPVYAQENYQLSGYALGAWTTICAEQFDYDPSGIKVTLIIEQPRVPGAGGAWETTMQRLLEFGQHTRRQAVLSQEEDAPFNPGVEQCKWCRARDVCSAHAEWHLEMIGIEFEELDNAELPDLPKEITPERRTMLLKMRPLLNRWLDGLHKSAYHDAQVGRPVPWMKLEEGRRPARKWKNNHAHKAKTVLVKELGDAAYHEPALLSPAQAEKAMGKARYDELVKRFVDQGTPSLILVPEEHTGTGVRSLEDEFDDLDETHELL